MRTHLCLALTCAALGCDPTESKSSRGGSTDDTAAESESPTTEDSEDSEDSGSPATAPGCRSEPRASDADRTLLVNLPYSGDGSDWAIFTLSADGTLTDTGASVSGGRTYLNPGVFTPDGSLGLAPLEDGTVAIFAVDEAGTVTVVESGYTSGFYAEAVAMHPSGERAWIVDRNWEENGGGLYVLDLDCETGTPAVPTDLPVDAAGRLVPAKLPGAALPVPDRPDRLVLVAGPSPTDLALIDTTTGTVLDEIDAFLDEDDAWLATGAITPTGDLVLLTDTSIWSSRANAIAAIALSGDTLSHAGLDELFDGVGIGISPDGTTAIVSSGYADDILRLSIAPGAVDPVSVIGSLRTSDSPSQLPGGIVTIQRGTLAGLSLVSEVYGLRSIQLGFDGEAMDMGLTGGRLTNPASMLVQP